MVGNAYLPKFGHSEMYAMNLVAENISTNAASSIFLATVVIPIMFITIAYRAPLWKVMVYLTPEKSRNLVGEMAIFEKVDF